MLGRTNQTFPPVWLSLAVPASSRDVGDLVRAANEAKTVIDVSTHPGLFGHFMRGTTTRLMGAGGADIAHAADEDSAANLIHAHLIETLSAVGRDWLDFYFLRVRAPLEEFQLSGALKALEWARDERHVHFVGLSGEASEPIVQGVWQFHDAFDVLLLGDGKTPALAAMADSRRVGIVRRVSGDPTPEATSLMTVRSTQEIAAAVRLNPQPESVAAG